MRERSVLPFTLQEMAELLNRAGDEEDQLTLMLTPLAHGIETGLVKGGEETSILVFSILGILFCLLL
jgi:hypothetical protein